MHFYFRFIAPNLDLVEQELTEVLWERISEEFRAFIGMPTFEELCREWVLAQARAGQLPLTPELVGSHWASDAQVECDRAELARARHAAGRVQVGD